MPGEDHPSYQNQLDHGAHWGPYCSETGDHRHWFPANDNDFVCVMYWTDTELNRPVAVIEALGHIGR